MTEATHSSIGHLALDVLNDLSTRIEKLRKKSIDDLSADRLHRIRISLRKARAALNLFEPIIIISKELSDKKIRAVARAFGRKRDNDVLEEKLEELTQGLEKDDQSLETIEKLLDKQEKKLSKKTEEILKSKSINKILERLQEWTEEPNFSVRAAEPANIAIIGLLQPTTDRVKTHEAWSLIAILDLENEVDELFDQKQGDIVHDLRKCAKELRYQIEFVIAISDERFVGIRDLLKKLQDCLGIVQDMRMLKAFLDKSLNNKWPDQLTHTWQNILATTRENVFEARRIAPQLQSSLNI